MDTVLTVIGLALAAGSIVPVFFANNQARVASVIIGVLLIVGLGYFEYSRWKHAKEVGAIESKMINMLSGNYPMSFDQMFTQMDYVDYSTATEAIDDLIDTERAHSKLLDVTDAGGKRYKVRVYALASFPIAE